MVVAWRTATSTWWSSSVGWQLKAITSVEVKGRVGPGGVKGLLVTFERPVG
jgi:Domain of unknown function (DUF4177)